MRAIVTAERRFGVINVDNRFYIQLGGDGGGSSIHSWMGATRRNNNICISNDDSTSIVRARISEVHVHLKPSEGKMDGCCYIISK